MRDEELIQELKAHYDGEYCANGYDVVIMFRFDRRDDKYKAIKELIENGKDNH